MYIVHEKMECVQHQVISLLRGELGVSVAHFCYLIMLLLFCFLRTRFIEASFTSKYSRFIENIFYQPAEFLSIRTFTMILMSWWVTCIICSTTCLYFLTPHFLVIATYSLSVIHFYGPHIQPPKILASKLHSLNIIPYLYK